MLFVSEILFWSKDKSLTEVRERLKQIENDLTEKQIQETHVCSRDGHQVDIRDGNIDSKD